MGMLFTYHEGYWPEADKAEDENPTTDKPKRRKAAKAEASED